MVCLHTDFMVDLLRLKREAWSTLESLRRDKLELSTTSVNICELFRGAFISKEVERTIQGLTAMIDSIKILDIDRKSCETFGRLSIELRKRGSPIADFDLLIASVALAHGESVLTRNRKHFEKIPGLVVDSW